MITFGQGKIEYFEFQLEGEEEIYGIPLAPYMPIGLIEEMNKADTDGDALRLQIKILRKYMGERADDLPISMLKEIIVAWSEASAESGATVGES